MDPNLTQFVTEEDYGDFGKVFSELAESGKSLTRLPRREFNRRQVLEAIDEAFQLIGGVPRLAFWAHNNPTDFYKLWGKTIPTASQLEIQGKLQHIIRPALNRSPLDYEEGEIVNASPTTSITDDGSSSREQHSGVVTGSNAASTDAVRTGTDGA